MKKKKNDWGILSVALIKKASRGDVLAIHKILKHYEGYIVALSTRSFYDKCNNLHYYVDETLKCVLETKLISKILDFSIT